MADEESFDDAYAALADGTENFSCPDADSLAAVLQHTPATLAPLRMIVGLTYNELSVAITLADPDARSSGEALKKFERSPPPEQPSPKHEQVAASIARAVTAAMSREILTVPPGAAGARKTAERYGMSPGPDFVIPDESPTLVVESKVGEDGGTVRDKAARIKSMTSAANARGLKACAVVDGKGWTERSAALLEVVVATQGRTYTLSTLSQILELPEIQALVPP